jgi:hypothetical protein
MRRRRIERNVTRGTGISAERLRAEGRWMNAELSERIKVQQGVRKMYDRGNSGLPRVRESTRERKMVAR